MAKPLDGAPRRWCTRYGGILSVPVVALGLLIAAAICVLVIVVLDSARGHIGGVLFNPRREIYAFSLLCVMLSLWLVLGQVFAYVTIGQAKKIQFIKTFFPPAIIAAYFREFASGSTGAMAAADALKAAAGNDQTANDEASKQIEAKFDHILDENFGLSVYIVPSILFAAVAFIVLFIGYAGGLGYAESLLAPTKLSPVRPLGLTLDLVSVAAIFGAFTWIASDAITRNHQWTFHPSDLSWYTVRLIFAVPLGQAVAVAWAGTGGNGIGASTGALIAFVISMFSLERINTLLSGVAAKVSGVPTASAAERDDVILTLPGVDEEKARALALEGVSTILQLKAVDPIRTSIRTGLPFEFVLALIDASILWIFVGNDLACLRACGFPGASYVLNFLDEERTALRNRLQAEIDAGSNANADQATQEKAKEAAQNILQIQESTAYLLSDANTRVSDLLGAIEASAKSADAKSKICKQCLRNIFSALAHDGYAIFIRNMYNTRTSRQ
jgi:hypothetical protein